MSNRAFKVLIGLATAATVAFGLDAVVHDTIGISNHSIVVGALAYGGFLGAFCVFDGIARRNKK